MIHDAEECIKLVDKMKRSGRGYWCNYRTGLANRVGSKSIRDNVWYGLRPQKNYTHCVESELSLCANQHIRRIHKVGQQLINQVRSTTGNKYVVNCIQILRYKSGTYKMPHFDGKYMTNGEQVWGMTLHKGKVMGIATRHHWGQAVNRHTLVKHAAATVYQMEGNMMRHFHHSITAQKYDEPCITIMFRMAKVSGATASRQIEESNKKDQAMWEELSAEAAITQERND